MTEKTFIEGDWPYDIETYPNCFTFTIIRAKDDFTRIFEISSRKNELDKLLKCLDYLRDNSQRLVGFNNLGFDYPVIHEIYNNYLKAKRRKKPYTITAEEIYEIAMAQIQSFKGSAFGHTIKADEQLIKQADLFKIYHFDNKAKSTSLKMLEFNMMSDNIEDLPFPVGTVLTEEQMDTLVEYNIHDVKETKKFYSKSIAALDLRAGLTEKYGIDFTNHNDGKIGKEYFIMRMEESSPGICYTYDSKGKRKLNQTKRKFIELKDCMFNYYDFQRPEFIAIFEWFKNQRITETKGVFSDIEEDDLGDVAQYAELTTKRKKFPTEPNEQQRAQFKIQHPMGWIEEEELKATVTIKNLDGTKTKVHKKSYWGCWRQADTLNVVINGFRFDFGTGGIHGSITSKIVKSSSTWKILDYDVESYYPNMAISNRVYPAHLSEMFCDVYEDVFQQRKSFPKGTPENAVMKLALNSVYGDSNNQFSPFYDPQYTMTITIGGQLSLCLLVDMWMREGVRFKMMMANTDGVTVAVHKDHVEKCHEIAHTWEKLVKLKLEHVEYESMHIRDVNSYLAVYKE